MGERERDMAGVEMEGDEEKQFFVWGSLKLMLLLYVNYQIFSIHSIQSIQ